jgi:phosphopantothenoylcysteine synthetase/decarboxylase
MKILVTAGNTQVLIDRVRCLTNIFTGRTGARIAEHAYDRGHEVTLLTSHPETVPPRMQEDAASRRWTLLPYRTFDDLQSLLSRHVPDGGHDAIIHCAAVSDYLAAGVFSPATNTHFDEGGFWRSTDGRAPAMVDRAAGKVKSDEPELWLRLVRAPKLIDRMRRDWAFRGVLVKFKLEVGITEGRLQEIAEQSRQKSQADLIVANTLEGTKDWALIGPIRGSYERVRRDALPKRSLDQVETLYEERRRG